MYYIGILHIIPHTYSTYLGGTYNVMRHNDVYLDLPRNDDNESLLPLRITILRVAS